MVDTETPGAATTATGAKIDGKIDCSYTNDYNAEAAPDQLLVSFIQYQNPVGKAYGLKDGQVDKRGQGKRTSPAIGQTMAFASFSDFVSWRKEQPSECMLTSGTFAGVGEVEVVYKDCEVGDQVVATKKHLAHREQPGVLIIDIDVKAADEVAGLWMQGDLPYNEMDDALSALSRILPEADDCALMAGWSTSSNIYSPDGELLKGKGGIRIYIPVINASLIPSLLETMHKRSWLHRDGWAFVDGAARFQDRSLVDLALARPTQPDFAAPDLQDGLTQDREWFERDGGWLAAVEPLSAGEQAEYEQAVSVAEAALAPAMAAQRAVWLLDQEAKGVKRGLSNLCKVSFHKLPVNKEIFARWCRNAAEQGHADAQYILGQMYTVGSVLVAQDYARAALWYGKAAERGHAEAQSDLGRMYAKGQGVPQDYAAAVRWYRKAAEQGNADAQEGLGVMYENGKGVSQDYVQAYKWRSLAAVGHAGAARNIIDSAIRKNLKSYRASNALEKRDSVAKLMTRAQIAEAQKLAREWRPKKQAASARAPDASVHRERIASAQRKLASLGYKPGPANGILGPGTRAAIRDFENREGLPVTGTISNRLEAALMSALPSHANSNKPVPRQMKKASTGSGFFVSPAGHVLTNEHVVTRCSEIRVAGEGKAARVATGGKIDLALLKLDRSKRSTATFREGRGIRTGSDVIVAGYPLQGLLSTELNVTTGIVSSLAGPRDDRNIIQITAPVQPGNSGGPLLDASGNVVGVVVSRLNAIKLAKITGALSQNVNFAVSEGAVRAFLDRYNVPYEIARSDKTKSTADIADKAKSYAVLIECWK